MKKIIFIIIFTIPTLFAKSQPGIKTRGSAYTIGKRKGELSLFQQSRYGIGANSELQAHPLLFFIMPNLHIKKKWGSFKMFRHKIAFASRHGGYYPQMFLNFLQSQSYIPNGFRPQNEFPFVLGFNNEIIFSTYLTPKTHCNNANHLLSLKMGAKYSYTSGNDTINYICKPVLHRETYVLKPNLVWHVQASLTGILNPFLYYYGDLSFHSYNLEIKHLTAESKIGLYGYIGNKTSIFGGVRTMFTTHPDVAQLYIYPLINISYLFRFKKDKSRERGLLKKDFNFKEMYDE